MACSARSLYDGQFWTQKLRPLPLSEMSKALSFKPQVGQNTALRASPAAMALPGIKSEHARDSTLLKVFLPGSFHFIVSLIFSPVFADSFPRGDAE